MLETSNDNNNEMWWKIGGVVGGAVIGLGIGVSAPLIFPVLAGGATVTALTIGIVTTSTVLGAGAGWFAKEGADTLSQMFNSGGEEEKNDGAGEGAGTGGGTGVVADVTGAGVTGAGGGTVAGETGAGGAGVGVTGVGGETGAGVTGVGGGTVAGETVAGGGAGVGVTGVGGGNNRAITQLEAGEGDILTLIIERNRDEGEKTIEELFRGITGTDEEKSKALAGLIYLHRLQKIYEIADSEAPDLESKQAIIRKLFKKTGLNYNPQTLALTDTFANILEEKKGIIIDCNSLSKYSQNFLPESSTTADIIRRAFYFKNLCLGVLGDANVNEADKMLALKHLVHEQYRLLTNTENISKIIPGKPGDSINNLKSNGSKFAIAVTNSKNKNDLNENNKVIPILKHGIFSNPILAEHYKILAEHYKTSLSAEEAVAGAISTEPAPAPSSAPARASGKEVTSPAPATGREGGG